MYLNQVINKKKYEKIVHHLRRHPMTFIPILGLFFVLMGVPVILYVIVVNLFPELLDSPTVYPMLVLGASVYFLSVYLFFYGYFIDYYLDLWIVTNDRIVDMEQHGLFRRTSTELDLFRIQDVSAHISGVFPTLFNYGDVTVKTASSNLDIVFRDVANPNGIRESLVHLADEDRKFHYAQEREESM
ncbi:MAG: PH domain-containing protein [Candidatus Magasanikbacteria bacterium]